VGALITAIRQLLGYLPESLRGLNGFFFANHGTGRGGGEGLGRRGTHAFATGQLTTEVRPQVSVSSHPAFSPLLVDPATGAGRHTAQGGGRPSDVAVRRTLQYGAEASPSGAPPPAHDGLQSCGGGPGPGMRQP